MLTGLVIKDLGAFAVEDQNDFVCFIGSRRVVDLSVGIVQHGPVQDHIAVRIDKLQFSCFTDDLNCRFRIVHTGQLDDETVLAFLLDIGFADAQFVDAVIHDRDQLLHVFRRYFLSFIGDSLQDNLDAALQVKTKLQIVKQRHHRNDNGNGDKGQYRYELYPAFVLHLRYLQESIVQQLIITPYLLYVNEKTICA